MKRILSLLLGLTLTASISLAADPIVLPNRYTTTVTPQQANANEQEIQSKFNMSIANDVDWTDYSAKSTIVGWTTSGRDARIYYKKIGNTVFFAFYIDGTSNATSVSFTLPYSIVTPMSNAMHFFLSVAYDNGTLITNTVCRTKIIGNTITCYANMGSGVWTNINEKIVQGQSWYECQ